MKVRYVVSLSFLALVILSPTLAPAFPVSASRLGAGVKGDQHDAGYRTAKTKCFVNGAWREC